MQRSVCGSGHAAISERLEQRVTALAFSNAAATKGAVADQQRTPDSSHQTTALEKRMSDTERAQRDA